MSRQPSLIHTFFSWHTRSLIRSSEYELSPPMLDHIVSQVFSGGTESSEEPGPPSRQNAETQLQGSDLTRLVMRRIESLVNGFIGSLSAKSRL
jgi:hypothetical protein